MVVPSVSKTINGEATHSLILNSVHHNGKVNRHCNGKLSNGVHHLNGGQSTDTNGTAEKSPSLDVDSVMSQLTLHEKVQLMTGDGWWHTIAIPRLNIPALRMSDGPNGIRGINFFQGTPASCFPCATGLAASFDISVAERVGKAIAQECIAKGVHIWLGPTMNTQRSPLGGRGFESFSEDPVLQGFVASSIIHGAQSCGISATQKHFVANEVELNRFQSSSNLSEKTLREIYLKPFQIVCSAALPNAIPWATMSAYNRVNDVHASESTKLLRDILREEWGWRGLLMSDWTGTYSTTEAIRAGLDLEMPGPSVVRGAAIGRAIAAGKLHASELDGPVRNIIEAVKGAQARGLAFDQPEASLDTPEMRTVLHDAAAASIVLLKNEKSVLPLGSLSESAADGKRYKISVIGPNSSPGSISGGGSASLLSTYTSSVRDAVAKEATKSGLDFSRIGWAQGAYSHRYLPPLAQYLTDQNGKENHVTLQFFGNSHYEGEPIWTTSVNVRLGSMFFIDNIPNQVPVHCYGRLTASFTPLQSGPWEFGLYSAGRTKLFIDNVMVVDNWSENVWKRGDAFFGDGSTEQRGIYDFSPDNSRNTLRIDFENDPLLVSASSPFVGGRGGMGFGGVPLRERQELIDESIKLARNSEEVILVVGLNGDWESEGFDRSTMQLPPGSNELIEAVLAANPRTVVVLQSGMPVEMPWIDKCSTLLQSWYGGNEHGNAAVSVIFGQFAPQGRLPISFPKAIEDCPNYLTFPETHHNGLYGSVDYNEGSNVGYRYYCKSKRPVLFEFGFGLSYTTFDWHPLQVTKVQNMQFDKKTIIMDKSPSQQDLLYTLQTRIVNTGSLISREVVQLYSTREDHKSVNSFPELRSFAVTDELKPGDSQVIRLSVRLSDLSIWDETYRLQDTTKMINAEFGAWRVVPGKYTFGLQRSCLKVESSIDIVIEQDEELLWRGIVTRSM